MGSSERDPLLYSRRDFGKMALAGLPLSLALAEINSKIKGVQIGAISYSFRSIPNAEDIIKAYVQVGLGEAEVMSNHVESLAGAPAQGARGAAPTPAAPPAGGPPPGAPPQAATSPGAPGAQPAAGRQGRGRAVMSPEEQAASQARAEELRKWRLATTAATFKPVRKKFDDAGIEMRVLCFNMNVNSTKDDEIEYAFMMAKALGVKAISTSTQVSMAKRTAPFANRHKIPLAFHGHDQTSNPDEVSTPETFAAITGLSKYHAINLDIGHFTAANYDPVAYIQQQHDRITHLHLKDRKRDHGANVPWGQGDTPIKEVLLLLRDRKWNIPGNIEFEYPGDPVVEVAKCYEYCKQVLST